MIIGSDDRIKLPLYSTDTGSFVQIISTYEDDYKTQSSGVMIGSNDVLTAAHAIYDSSHGGYASQVLVTPSKFGDFEPYSSVYTDAVFVSDGWLEYEISYYDYAVLSLSSAVGFDTGYKEIAFLQEPQSIIGEELISYGYPGDKDGGNWLYSTTGSPDALYADHILTFENDLDIYFGQSGSPLLYDEKVTAIVVSQFENGNNALFLNETSYENILNWSSQNNQNLTSQEIILTTQESITALYIAFFNRAPDYEGLNYWMSEAESAQSPSDITKIIASEFAQHELFTQIYENLDNRSFIEAIYQNMLGTSGDEQGIFYWENALSSQERYSVVDDMIKATLCTSLQSEEFAYLTYSEYFDAKIRQDTLSNKVEVALYYTQHLGSSTNITNPQEDSAYIASQEVLQNITDDYSSVEVAITGIDSTNIVV